MFMNLKSSDGNKENNGLDLYEKIRKTNASDPIIGNALHSAMDVLDQALRLYGPSNVYSSYNGGKDAVVIMHLLRAAVAKYSYDRHEIHAPLLVYFAIQDEFPEVLEYIQETEIQYGLHVFRSNSSIVKGLTEIIEEKSKTNGENAQHLAFVLGTRQGDPNCGEQSYFSPSSAWMPPFMRVNPILKWSYSQVWQFLRMFELSYCKLYDQGYTSLGKRSDTRPNPALRKNKYLPGTSSNQAKEEYYPAYMLADGSLERAGRAPKPIEKPKSTETNTNLVENTEDSAGNGAHVGGTAESVKNDGRMAVESVGMIIIGDEILSGLTTESNMQITSTTLGSIGIPLKRVTIVSDVEEEIVREIRLMSQEFDVVITSGGIGPTHDDVTIKAVATLAFGQVIEANADMISHLTRAHAATGAKEPMRSSFLRLAELPSKSTLRFPPNTKNDGKLPWPILQCNNVFVLPGIPDFFAEKIKLIAENFLIPKKVSYFRKVSLSMEEKDLVSVLDETVAAHPAAKFGSYPFVNRSDYKTVITVQGAEESVVSEALQQLLEKLPSYAVVAIETISAP